MFGGSKPFAEFQRQMDISIGRSQQNDFPVLFPRRYIQFVVLLCSRLILFIIAVQNTMIFSI
jgi:hypothetical protein